jgi:hypothetical protein
MLHFVPDDDGAFESVARLTDSLPSGSYIVLSHVTLEKTPTLAKAANEALEHTDIPSQGARSISEISRFLDGLNVLSPGLVKTRDWRPDNTSDGETCLMEVYAAVAHKP